MEKNQKVSNIIQHMEQVIIGKREILELSLITLLGGGHLLLEDVPGVGKTTLAKTLAVTTGCDFSRIQFTPDTLPSDVLGVTIYNMQKGTFEYVKGAVFGNIILADEINRTSPKTQASLLEVMEEKQVTVDGATHPMQRPFMVIATQNPIDYLGTYHLPEAQLDRFFMKLSVGYPSFEEEKKMTGCYLQNEKWKEITAITDASEICQMQKEVMQIFVHEDVIDYLIKIVEGTRKNDYVSLGASPRATLAVIRGAQAVAYCEGRDYVIPDDIIRLLKPMLLHRMLLSPEANLNQMTVEKVLDMEKVKVRVPIL